MCFMTHALTGMFCLYVSLTGVTFMVMWWNLHLLTSGRLPIGSTLCSHGYLGKGNRKVAPSCVVWKIRDNYPAPDNNYLGFRDH